MLNRIDFETNGQAVQAVGLTAGRSFVCAFGCASEERRLHPPINSRIKYILGILALCSA